MRHKTIPAKEGGTIYCDAISFSRFLKELRWRAGDNHLLNGIAGDLSFRSHLHTDPLFNVHLFAEFIRAMARIIQERHNGTIQFRRIEYLRNRAGDFSHKIWIQIIIGWLGTDSEPTKRPKNDETKDKQPRIPKRQIPQKSLAPNINESGVEKFKRTLFFSICDHYFCLL